MYLPSQQEVKMGFSLFCRTVLFFAILTGLNIPTFATDREKLDIYETDGPIRTKNGKGFDFGPLSKIEPSYIKRLQKTLKEGGDVLSVACGYGRTEYRALLGENVLFSKPHPKFRLTLVDLSKEHLTCFWYAAKAKFGKNFLDTHVRLVHGDCLKFLHNEKEESKYDLLYAGMFIHFLSPDNIDIFLKGARKALKDSAPLYLTCGSPYSSNRKLSYFTKEYRLPLFALISPVAKDDLTNCLMTTFNKLFYDARISGKMIPKPKYKHQVLTFEDYLQQCLLNILNENLEEPKRVKEFPGWRLPSMTVVRNYFTPGVLCKVLKAHGFIISSAKSFSLKRKGVNPKFFKVDDREITGVICLNGFSEA